MRFAGRTHPGRRAGENEDSIGWDPAAGLWFVADGMGGHARGDVASRIVKETLLAFPQDQPLRAALLKAHAAVAAAGPAHHAEGNMGSTAVAVRVGAVECQIAWVGDSRAYLWRAGKLNPLTRDHSYLEELRRQGQLSETQMHGHPNRNLVTQTLGIGVPEPSVDSLSLRAGDWILLCTDGLNDELSNADIAAVLERSVSPEAAAEALVQAALAHGGRDNVSAIVLEPDAQTAKRSLLTFMPSGAWAPVILGVAAAIILAAILGWFHGR